MNNFKLFRWKAIEVGVFSVVGLSALAYVMWHIVAILAFFNSPHPPSDTQLIATFKQHRDVFEKLKVMACTDNYQHKYINASNDFPQPEGISQARLKEYQHLLNTIQTPSLIKGKNCSIRFEVWSKGFAGDGEYKYYEFNPPHIQNKVSSLDNLSLKPEISSYYRKLENEWYLSYTFWP